MSHYMESRIRSGDARQSQPVPVFQRLRLSNHSSNPELSATVVICTQGRPHELGLCLQAVAQLRYAKFDVLVVENGPPDFHTRALAECYGARYLNSPRLGLSRARNDGARACHTDLVAYLDDDSRPHRDWLQAIAAEFADPLVIAVGGGILPRTRCAPMPNAPLPEGLRLREHRVVDRDTPGWFTLTNFGGIGDGCNMAFRRAAFGLWSGFDERLGRSSLLDSAEEHLSFFQLVLLGFRCVHTPGAVVWHPLPEDLPAWRRYNRHNMTNAIAYAALLWSEFPETRLLLLRHMYERSFGPRARARAESGVPQLSLIEKLRVIRAGLDLYSKLPKRSAREVPLALPTYETFAAQK
jgi:cellulose synthase/poly-beta-1,6-N-acetylglucosamine synthase-like glycosyltransferase